MIDLKQIESKFVKFAVGKDFKDIDEIKQDFFDMYDEQFGYGIVKFFDETDLKPLFF